MPSGVNVPVSSLSARDGHDANAALDPRPRAIEVHALFEDTVIAVASLPGPRLTAQGKANLTNPRGGRASRATQALLSAGAAALAVPIVSFAVAYVDAIRVQRAWAA